jgi:hypothetical protein
LTKIAPEQLAIEKIFDPVEGVDCCGRIVDGRGDRGWRTGMLAEQTDLADRYMAFVRL